jgi:RNA polymerase sigma factor (sigma-70 family)
MASGAFGTALEHLRDLFNSGTTVGQTDGQLLSRYAASHDGAAFEALVARHGPMVLATCRAILRHEHDIEDAFQATFLVLARKAGTVWAGNTLGGWLHQVAYRVAVQLSVEVKRRRLRESEVLAMATPVVNCPELDPDLGSILHEEIDRLPEVERLPVVLCDLEGLTYEQAAGCLHWTVPALGCRLSKARKRLRDRLIRRGVTATVLGALTAARVASAAVPAMWSRTAVVAATTGSTSAVVIALTQTIIRGMLITKLQIAATATLAAVVLVSAGVTAVGAGRFADLQPVTTPGFAKAQTAEANVASPKVTQGEAIALHGRVVDPSGKPVSGAIVQMAYLDTDDQRMPKATTGSDGRFLVRIPRSIRNLNGYDEFPWVVASAPGFGTGWTPGAFKAAASGELTIRLVEDGPPIEGRVIDLEGHPVSGAQVKATQLFCAGHGDLTAWLAEARDRGFRNPGDGLNQLPTMIPVTTTDADGRFHLAGIGRERIAELLISGPRIATTQVYAMNRDGAEVRTINQAPMSSTHETIHARRFEQAVAPPKPIQGVIRDKDSGRPIAGLMLHAAVFNAQNFIPYQYRDIKTTTDAQGRYRVTGLPKAPAYRLSIEQSEGSRYPSATFRAPAESPAFVPVNFDISLKRGVVIRGRVTDKATGQPVAGYIHAFTFQDNSFVKDFPGYVLNELDYVFIDADGRYEVIGLPGRNIIACRSEMRRFRGCVGASTLKGYDPKLMAFYNTLPLSCYFRNYHVLAELDIDSKAESATIDLQVDSGRSLMVTAIDPDGRPIGGTKASGITDLFSSSIEYEQDSPSFEINGLDPSTPRRVIITHSGRKLIGSAYLKGDEAAPVTIRLQPWGTIVGRIIDDDGQPCRGLDLTSAGGSYPARPDVQGVLPADVLIGSDGRFRIDRLVPGLEYGASASDHKSLFGQLFHDLKVAPGEIKDLGDLKVVPPKKDGQPFEKGNA